MKKKTTTKAVIVKDSLCQIHHNEKGTLYTFDALLSALIPKSPSEHFIPTEKPKRGKVVKRK
jgi:hypothetical protein